MQFGRGRHCVWHNGNWYRADIRQTENAVGLQVAVLWIGPAHRLLPSAFDDAVVQRVGAELLAEWEVAGRLAEIEPDADCAGNGLMEPNDR